MANANQVNNLASARALENLLRDRSVTRISEDALKDMTKADLKRACDHFEVNTTKGDNKETMIRNLMDRRGRVVQVSGLVL